MMKSFHIAVRKSKKSTETKTNLTLYYWIEDLHSDVWLQSFVPVLVPAVMKTKLLALAGTFDLIWFTQVSWGSAKWWLSYMQEKCRMIWIDLGKIGMKEKQQNIATKIKKILFWANTIWGLLTAKTFWKPFSPNFQVTGWLLFLCLNEFFFSASSLFSKISCQNQIMKQKAKSINVLEIFILHFLLRQLQ